jgi:hypothetical protein
MGLTGGVLGAVRDGYDTVYVHRKKTVYMGTKLCAAPVCEIKPRGFEFFLPPC